MVLRFGPLAAAGMISIFPAAVPADAAARLDAHLSALDTVSARFEQRVFDEQHNLFEETGGTVLIDRPGRFRFDYEDPPQLIVGDGAKVWIYDRELAQVTVRRAGDALGSTPAVLLASGRPVAEAFRVQALGAGGGFDWFGLEPKAEDAAFVRIRLGFSGGELRRMELLDRFGQTTRLDFDDLRRNPAVPAGAFAFVPPAGVDVIVADP